MTTKVESNHPQHQEVNEVEQDSNETSSSEDQTSEYFYNVRVILTPFYSIHFE